MKYTVQVTGDDGNWYYQKKRLWFIKFDSFTKSIEKATLFSSVESAEKVKAVIQRDWKPKFISDTAKIIAVNFQIMEELRK